MKNINWKNILTILVVGAIGAILLAPYIKPLLQKIPVVGAWIK